MQPVRAILALYLFACCIGAFGATPSKQVGFSDLPSGAQSNISATLGHRIPEYQATSTATGFHTTDLHHRLTSDFDGRGVVLHAGDANWTMKLSAYGHGKALQAVPSVAPEVKANRVQYQRGAITEWYLNGPIGLEQGFTVNERLGKAEDGQLTLAMAIEGDPIALDKDHKVLALLGKDGKARLTYGGLCVKDATGRELQASLDLRSGQLLLQVDDRDASYPIVIDPWVQVAQVTSSNGGNQDEFGWSVAAGDSIVVVGAPFHNVGSNAQQGMAYVFAEPDSGWDDMTETGELIASDGVANAFFGASVAISGNVIVIGAGGATINGNQRQGAVYVFVEPSNGWTNMPQTAELTASDGYVGDNLGNSVSISGNTIAAGAPYASVGSNFEQGATYVFVQPSGGWSNITQTAKLTASDGAAGDILGVAVNINANTVVAGASEATVNGYVSAGAAYLFVAGTNGWQNMTQTTQVFGKGTGAGDYFGRSISIGGNAGIAGAPFHINSSNGSQGAAFIFQALNTHPSLTSLNPTSATAGGNAFTLSVYGSNFVGGAVVNWNGSPRNTTYISPTEVQAEILASDIAQAGTFRITAKNPPPGGGTSNPLSFSVNNPVPNILSLKPSSAIAGGPQFTLTVNGSNFIQKSRVTWNGLDLVTTYVSSTQLTAIVTPRDIANAGTANVGVTNPAPGGGASNVVTFTIDNPVPSLTQLLPSSIKAGSSAFTLAVKGSNFVSTSQVYWNGSPRKTTYIGPLTLQAAILASDVKNPGTAKVTVGNPAPGGGASNSLNFTINP